MTDSIEMTEQEQEAQVALEGLKSRADLLGVAYHPNIKAEKLKDKIIKAQAEKEAKVEAKPVREATREEIAEERLKLKKRKMNEARKEAQKLVRVRITCMNPNKREWPGEIISVSNGVVGTVKKYIPFNADDGYHVPQFILDTLKDRKCAIYVTKKLPNGQATRKHKLIKEFAIEELGPLSKVEIEDIRQRQLANKSED